jgi:isoleucyl-tRNA synthetase
VAKTKSFGKLPENLASEKRDRQNRPYFDELDTKVDFPALEREILDYWHKAGIVKKYLRKNRNSKKRFSFLDGPITANNPMGVHHAWGRPLAAFQKHAGFQTEISKWI